MPAGLGPKGSERECIPDLSLASSGLQAIFGIPWLEDASPRSLSSSLHDILSVSYFIFIRQEACVKKSHQTVS